MRRALRCGLAAVVGVALLSTGANALVEHMPSGQHGGFSNTVPGNRHLTAPPSSGLYCRDDARPTGGRITGITARKRRVLS